MPEPSRQSPLKIVVVSDSLTNSEPSNWLAQAQASLSMVTLVAEAHGGWTTTSYFRERLAHEAFANVPADAHGLILLLGSNNLFEAQGGSDAAVADAVLGVQRIASHVSRLAPGAKHVMLMAPPTVALRNVKPETLTQDRRVDAKSPVFLGKLSQAYRDLATQLGWAFVDLYPVLNENDYVDAAHPSDAGNRKLAEAIAPAVAQWANSIEG